MILFICLFFMYLFFIFELTSYEYAITLVDRIWNWSIPHRKMKLYSMNLYHILSTPAWLVFGLYFFGFGGLVLVQKLFWSFDMLASSCIIIVPNCAGMRWAWSDFLDGSAGLEQNHCIPTAAVHTTCRELNMYHRLTDVDLTIVSYIIQLVCECQFCGTLVWRPCNVINSEVLISYFCNMYMFNLCFGNYDFS